MSLRAGPRWRGPPTRRPVIQVHPRSRCHRAGELGAAIMGARGRSYPIALTFGDAGGSPKAVGGVNISILIAGDLWWRWRFLHADPPVLYAAGPVRCAADLCGCSALRGSAGGYVIRIGERGVSQASLVIIRHAPRIVQAASQAMMTQTASVADSGSSESPCRGRRRLRLPPAARIPPAARMVPGAPWPARRTSVADPADGGCQPRERSGSGSSGPRLSRSLGRFFAPSARRARVRG